MDPGAYSELPASALSLTLGLSSRQARRASFKLSFPQRLRPTGTLTGCVSEGSDGLALGRGPAPAVRRGHGSLPFNPVERGPRKEGSVLEEVGMVLST